MVRRTAFTQLRHSWPLLGLTVLVLALLFAVPPVITAFAAVERDWLALGLAAVALTLMTALYLPTVRYFGLAPAWALTLPLAGLLYGAMTVDSALRRGGPD
jgi:hypothetical protein